MLPGNDQYYKCPECENILSKGTLMSGNTFGAVHYSDAKVIARMLPQFPQISKCYDCSHIFWLNAEKVVIDPVGKKVDAAKFLSIDEYIEALDNNIFSSKEEEIYIRQHIWWKFNDRTRQGKQLFLDDNDERIWKENLYELENLLDSEDNNGKLLIIELNRNLGNFEKCKYLLGEIDNPDVSWIIEKFEIEVEKKNTFVVQI